MTRKTARKGSEVVLHRKRGAGGGHARAQSLSSTRKKEIASAAAAARWKRRDEPPTTAYVGDLRLGEAIVACAVLPDGRRVLSRRGFGFLFGRIAGGRTITQLLPLSLVPDSIRPFVGPELAVMISEPITYRAPGIPLAYGIPARALPLLCDSWLRAREAGGLTLKNQLASAAKAEVLIRALAQTAIEALVDEATGFQAVRPQNALQQYLEKLIRKELAAWSKKFPDEFYENIYKLKNWPWFGMSKNRYSAVAQMTRDLVYQRLAPGLLRELEEKTPPHEETGRRPNKLHQWLTDDVGDPMLSIHLTQLLTLQRLALAQGYGWNRFVHTVDKVLPKKGSTLDLPFEDTIVDG